MITVDVDPRPSSLTVQLQAFAARHCRRLFATRKTAAASTRAVEFGWGPRTQHGRSESTANSSWYTVANGAEFRLFGHAKKLQRLRQSLLSAVIRKVGPTRRFRCDGNWRATFFPISWLVVHTFRPDYKTVLVAELYCPSPELHASALPVGNVQTLKSVAVDSHVWHVRYILDEAPPRLAFVNDSARLGKQRSRIHNAVMRFVEPVSVAAAESLTRRAGDQTVKAASDAGKLTDVAAQNQFRARHNAETCAREFTVEQTDAGKQR